MSKEGDRCRGCGEEWGVDFITKALFIVHKKGCPAIGKANPAGAVR